MSIVLRAPGTAVPVHCVLSARKQFSSGNLTINEVNSVETFNYDAVPVVDGVRGVAACL